MLRRVSMWALLGACLLGSPRFASAQVPKILTEKDRFQLMLAVAEAAFKAKNVDGAKVCLLAVVPLMPLPQQGPPQMQGGRARMLAKQVEKVKKLVPVIYKDHKFTGDVSTLKALLAKHQPILKKHAEIMRIPPMGSRPKSYGEHAARLVAAQRNLKTAGAAAKDFAREMPSFPDEQNVYQTAAVLTQMAAKGRAPANPQQKAVADLYPALQDVHQSLMKIMVGIIYVNPQVKTDVVDRNLQELRKKLKDFDADKASADLNPAALDNAAYVVEKYAPFVILADPENAEAKALQAKVPTWRKMAADVRAKLVEKNRLPSESYGGKDADALRTRIEKQWNARYPKEVVLRVLLTSSDWGEEVRAKVVDDTIIWKRYMKLPRSAISVEITAKDGSKKYLVHRYVVERLWNGTEYGEPYIYQPLGFYPYEVTKEHSK